ncbi:MAG TPA: integrase [Candidatus Melainabacteria bacterium]|nr:integrase [Candidatus Melainabacteria bacterium]HIN63502.1 integrase [Candidatus Obscuribacterales bacterium]
MDRFIRDRSARLRMRVGPLAPYMDEFAQRLTAKGFKRKSGRYHFRLVAAFSSWLKAKRIKAQSVRHDHVQLYLRERKQLPRPGDATCLNGFLDMLRDKGIVMKFVPALETTPAESVAEQFAQYLRQERGLAGSTICAYSAFVKAFLEDVFDREPIDWSSLSVQDVIKFVQRKAKIIPPKHAQYLTTALRSFLKYARYRDYIQADFAAAVPAVASWSMAGIPKALPLVHIERVLSSCDRTTIGGRRDYAIFLLLARLGLRAGEIVSLKLADLDWINGSVSIRGKGGKCARLPMPIDVGEAIVDYLQNGRPPANSRILFLRETAPIAGFKDQQAIGSVVRRALKRAGIDAPRQGSHQFRHALATNMLHRGASLSEIGEILRHQLPCTTAIYAKVDLAALRELALPWTGGVQ